MSRAAVLFGFAGAIALLRVTGGLFGLAAHTSAIAGMPISSASNVIASLWVLLHLAAVVVAPIFAAAGMLEAGAALRRRQS